MTGYETLPNSVFSSAAACQDFSTSYGEGVRTALVTLAALAVAEADSRAALLTEALADLIDVGLSWNNLHATEDRLRGFAGVLVQHLPGDAEPQLSLAEAHPRSALLTSLRA